MLKGPSIASGYFNNAAAWAEVIDENGWFHTGDLARYDEDWHFYIVDRLKDMFISGGENASVEELLTHLGEQLARYKIPRHVEFVTALPISAAGKVLRRELRER